MNEYDDILNRIVEEFFDTGRLKLLEDIELDSDEEDNTPEDNVSQEELDSDEEDNTPEDNTPEEIEKKYIFVFDNFFKKKLTSQEISDLSVEHFKKEIPRKTINNWTGDKPPLKFINFILKHYKNLTKERFYLIRLFRNYLFNDGDMKRHIRWNEKKMMYDYPEIPSFEEIEKMVKDVEENKIPRDTAFSQLYNNYEAYFTRERYKYAEYDKKVMRINTILKSEYGYDDEKIKEYLRLVIKLMEIAENVRTKEKEDDKLESILSLFEKINNKKIEGHERKEIEKEIKKLTQIIKKEHQNYQKYWQEDTIYFKKSSDRERGSIIGNYINLLNTSVMNVIDKSIKENEFSCDNDNETIDSDELKKQVKFLLDKIDISKFTQKHDVECIENIKYEGKPLIKVGDYLDVKKVKQNDSYLFELISPFKQQDFYKKKVGDTEIERRYCDFYKKIYNKIIDTLLVEMNKGGYLEKIKKQISEGKKGLKGLIIDGNYFVPLDSLELYWSNKGFGSDHRVTLRYNINGLKYKLNLDPVICRKKENCTEQEVTVNKEKTAEPVEKKQHPSEIFQLSESKTTDRLDEIIENFFDTGKFVF